MTDESTPSADGASKRGAVARLAEALAAAQATAREQNSEVVAAVTDHDAPASEEAATRGDRDEDPEARQLFDRLQHLPPIEDAHDADAATSLAAAPEVTVGERQRRSRRPSRDSLRPLYALMVVLVLAVPILGFIGLRSVGSSTRGQVLSGHARPSAPGYQALVEPTPVALVMQVDADGNAVSLTLLSLSGPDQKGGAVVSIPVGARLAKPLYRYRTLGELVRRGSVDSAAASIAGELGLGFTEAMRLDPAKLTSFLQPAGAITIDNPVDVHAPDGERFAKGTIAVSPSQAPGYLAANDDEGSEITRLQRIQLFWKAWIQKIHDAGGRRGIVPGEADAGLGRYLRGLAAGTSVTASLPILPADPLDGKETFALDREASRILLTNAVPFPVAGNAGDRATAKVLNGTGPGAIPPAILQRIAFAGIQMNIIGNAPRFDVQRTTITYSDPTVRPFVLLIAGVLGPVRIVHAQSGEDNTDITIVIGKDLMANPPGALVPTESGR